jgi:DNA-binding transcriptional ArsR family regulator
MTPFEAVAEPNRRAILDLLRGGELPAGDLVEATGLSQPGVSKHLRIMREAGLLETEKQGKLRVYAVPAHLRTQLAANNTLDLGCCTFRLDKLPK